MSGIFIKIRQFYFLQIRRRCPLCHGKGRIFYLDDTCPEVVRSRYYVCWECDGSGRRNGKSSLRRDMWILGDTRSLNWLAEEEQRLRVRFVH